VIDALDLQLIDQKAGTGACGHGFDPNDSCERKTPARCRASMLLWSDAPRARLPFDESSVARQAPETTRLPVGHNAAGSLHLTAARMSISKLRAQKLMLALAAFVGLASASAQAPSSPPPASPPRPKTALVLGGGGALGLAHIGVLKVLHEANVPVDLVTGTSMGALVGGGYAAGHTPEHLANIVRGADWTNLFAGRAPRDQLHWRRKEEDYRFGRFELGLDRRGITVPTGAIGGQALQQYFRELARPVRDITDLDRLPLPFRSVATDIVTGTRVVLKDVPLDFAMRASMSVPGAFTPLEQGERLLVDGGLVDNLPVGVARGMGAQRVIAVRVGSTLLPRQDLVSALGLAAQMLSIMVERNERDSIAALGADDLLIEIDTTGFASSDFTRAPELIARGEAAARKALERLRAFAVRPEAFAAHEAGRVTRSAGERVSVIGEIVFERTRVTDARALANEMEVPLDRPASDAQLRAAAGRLYGRGDFERVDTRLEPMAPGVLGQPRERLIVTPLEKRWGPQYVRLGGRLSSNLRDENTFDLSIAHTWTWLNPWGAEWRTQGQLGERRELQSEIYQPLGPGSRWFVMPLAATLRNEFEEFSGDRVVARFENVTSYVAAQLGYAWPGLGLVRAGYGRSAVETRQLVGTERAIAPRVTESRGQAQLRLDTIDDNDFPRSGYFVDVQYNLFERRLGTARRRDAVALETTRALSAGRNAWLLTAAYGESVQEGAFRLGGFGALSGTRLGRISGSRFALGRVLYYRNVSTRFGGFDTPIYVGASLEAGNAVPSGATLGLANLERAAALFVGIDSFAGPLYLAWGYTQNRTTSLYLLWGRL
jgi:NTE family protein